MSVTSEKKARHKTSPGAREHLAGAGCGEGRVIALERRLRHCRHVLTLGVRPNLESYPEEALDMIQMAEKVYYPSVFYADLFDAMGKATFPSAHTYRYVQDKIKQTALFKLLGIPHPRTHVYYGRNQQRRIRSEFAYPFVAKVARGSALGRGVYLIQDHAQLEKYLAANRVAYIQQYMPIDRDIRAVVVGTEVVHAYWRVSAAEDFRTNVSAGGRILLDEVPRAALELARQTALECGWNDVGLDICCAEGRWYVLEGNMKYGKAGFRAAGIDYYHMMDTMIANGTI